jgi:hypothetical protein
MSEDVVEKLGRCWIMSEKFLKMLENVRKCWRMFEDDVGGCRRTSEDAVEKFG